MRPQVVATGIDSLYIGFNIQKWSVDETAFALLEDGKKEAGNSMFGGKGVTVKWHGSEFNLLAKGTKGYEYVMYNDDLRLCLAKNCQGGRVFPEVLSELNSSYLWGKGYGSAYGEFRNWLCDWAVVGSEKVNRVDLCVDLAVKLPVLDVKREVVTRCRKKVDYFNGEHYTDGIRDTGYKFGRGEIVARIYDKKAELKRSEKSWFRDIWKQGGWDGDLDITRVEGQFRRPYLKDMGVNSYSEMVETIPDMWRGLTKEWLIIKQRKETDSNRRRWPISPFWEVVQDAGSKFGECLGVQRWKQKQAKIEPLLAQMKGLMATEVAIDSMIRGEYFAINRLRSELNGYIDSEDFRTKVLDRRGRYSSLKG